MNDVLTTNDLSQLIRANPSSVNKWADKGDIKHYRTPGGHRRYKIQDVMDFSEKFKMPMYLEGGEND